MCESEFLVINAKNIQSQAEERTEPIRAASAKTKKMCVVDQIDTRNLPVQGVCHLAAGFSSIVQLLKQLENNTHQLYFLVFAITPHRN